MFALLASFAEFEREQICERTKAGMAAAKRRGKHIGRPRKLTDTQIAYARAEVRKPQTTIKSIAAELGVCVKTLSRAISETADA